MIFEIINASGHPTPVTIVRDDYGVYNVIDSSKAKLIELERHESGFTVIRKNIELSDSNLSETLDQAYLLLVENEQSGSDNSDESLEFNDNPFNPDDIKVAHKQFGLRLLAEMISENEIDLSPDFQRNFVWNNFQKSRLIESILLRIPLPMFYFSEDESGRFSIIDGLQRLTTIKEFMENKFPLRDLEYLESCKGKYYRTEGNKEGIDHKYYRWFNLTQISVNIIDPSSPYKVKYDIFRRINTGGKPLNNQEIRNCLCDNRLRNLLKIMVELPSFKTATDGSIKGTRLDDQEIALRFVLFYNLFSSTGDFRDYTGYMENELDSVNENYGSISIDGEKIIKAFDNAMKIASYLLEPKYAFRKIITDDLSSGASKKLVNKALFICESVIFSELDYDFIVQNFQRGSLRYFLAQLIENDLTLNYYLSYGTNGKNNMHYSFNSINDLINSFLN